MLNPLTLLGSPAPPTDLRQVIQNLATAEDTATVRQIVADHPGLLHPSLDSCLTQYLQKAWEEGDKIGTRDLLACRVFLARCQNQDIDAVLTETSALPLASSSPLGQLLELTYERTDLPRRAKLARQVLADVRRTSEPELWAALQRELADCLSQSEGPDRAEHLEEALDAYQATLEVRGKPPYVGSPVWAQTLHAMAATLRRRVKGNRADNLKQALQLYQEALTVRTKKAYPGEWAETQHDLGATWLEMPVGDRAENVQKGIECYRAALSVRTRRTMPDLWAVTTHDLAIAYTEHPVGDRAQNLEEAIRLCRAVQEIWSPDEAPLDWGRSQVALSNAYVMRLKGGRAENLEQAIDGYTKALRVLSREAYPADWARVHYNLANAYWFYPADRAGNLDRAIKHFQQALEVYTHKAYPMEWAHVETGLGNIFCQPEVGQRANSLEQAIACYQAALTVRTHENDPTGWATIQNNLGNAYADRILEDQVDNQEQAIACYELALLERTRKEAPAGWAETMNNLGTVYIERLRGNPTQNREEAIRCLRQALKVHKPLVFPNDSRRAAHNLAHLLFSQKRWKAAAHYYAVAIEATERLYQAAVTEPGRQAELAESQDLFANRAYALARLGRFEKAVECLESGRARALVESLDLQRLAMAGLSPIERDRLHNIVDHIRNLEAELRDGGPRSFPVIAADLEKARSQLPDLDEKIQFATIGQTAKLEQPLVYLVATSHGSLAILVPAGAKQLSQREIVWLDHLTSFDLRHFLLKPCDEKQPGSYLEGTGVTQHGATGQRWRILQGALQSVLPQLGQRLMGPLAKRLKESHVEHITLIPGGLLSLFPLHAACYPVSHQDYECRVTNLNGQRYFLDDFDVTYAPAARILGADSRISTKLQSAQPSLFAVGDPQPLPPGYSPLPFARIEVEGIAGLFTPDTYPPLYETEATYTAVKSQLRQKPPTYLHFACHGEFNPLEPLASGLSLAWQGQHPNDRPTLLTLKDLLGHFTLAGVRLVVLSACQTAITEMERVPDEAIGLPAGFLQAGASAVIGSLWPVSDVSTALLMGRFYLYHLKGDPDRPEDGPLQPAQALRRAQQWLRDEVTATMAVEVCFQRAQALRAQGGQAFELAQEAFIRYDLMAPASRPFTHPAFWAPFTLSGQGANL